MNDYRTQLSDLTTNLGERAGDVAHDLQDRAHQAWDSAHEQTDRALTRGAAYVHHNPLPTALAAFGIGLAVGVTLLYGRKPATLRQRLVEEPLHQSRGVMLGLAVACAAMLRRAWAPTLVAAHELGAHVEDEVAGTISAVKKTVRKNGHKPAAR